MSRARLPAPQEAGDLFRSLVDAAPDAIVVVDGAGTLVLVNTQTEALFGYRREELVGQPIEVLVPDRFRPSHVGRRDGYLSTPRTRPMGPLGSGVALRARRRDGSEFPVEISLSPLDTPDGRLVCAAVRDVTERLRIQAETDRVKEEVLATVSHELRTPLTSILGYAELMADLESDELGDQGRAMLAVVRRNAERELRLVDDLLTLALIGGGRMSMRLADVALAGVVEDAVRAAAPRAEEAQLGLVSRIEGCCPVRGDAQRLGQVVDNLLGNALKFTRPGGRIEVRVGTAGAQAVVEVEDDGPGIEAADLGRLFDRLYRAPSAVADQIPGAGLGLAIVKALVEAHCGTVEVRSTVGVGTVFRVCLPLQQAPAGDRTPTADARHCG